MTCIIGLVEGKDVYMGGDSAGVTVKSLSLAVRADEKVFKKGDFLIGFTSSFRMGQLLRYNLKVPEKPKDMNPFEFMVTMFVEAVRKCLKAGGYAKKDKEEESGGTFLVGYSGKLFRVDSDYQVGENVLPFDAVGCGEQVANGAMFASSHLPPRKRILQALLSAERFSGGVRRPFHIIKLT